MDNTIATDTRLDDGLQRRMAFVRWLRNTHGWFGLWGAVLGLMMGFSGIWLNHRNVLKLPLETVEEIQQAHRQASVRETAREMQKLVGPRAPGGEPWVVSRWGWLEGRRRVQEPVSLHWFILLCLGMVSSALSWLEPR